MFGSQFYHQSLRRYIIMFGNMFNDIVVRRYDKNGNNIQAVAVPLAYGPKEKFLVRITQDPKLDQQVAMQLPRLGFEMTTTKLVAVENTEDTHNVVVCTLCSCYPRDLLGLPPAWYKSRAYRARVVREPRDVLREFGTELPDNVALRVHDSTADIRFLVVPQRPAGTEGMSEAQLTALVTRDSMIGVSLLHKAQ